MTRRSARRPRPVRAQDLLLLDEDLRAVELEQAGADRPCQAKRARIQAGAEQHDLPHALLVGDAFEEVVEEAGTDGDDLQRRRVATPLDPRLALGPGEGGSPSVVEQPILTAALVRTNRGHPARGRRECGDGHERLLSFDSRADGNGRGRGWAPWDRVPHSGRRWKSVGPQGARPSLPRPLVHGSLLSIGDVASRSSSLPSFLAQGRPPLHCAAGTLT